MSEPMTPNHQQAADAAIPKAMFICAAFKIIEQGPYINLQIRERRKYVYRCDLDEGHEGDHIDQVLLVNWPQEPVSPPAASPEQAAELPEVDVTEAEAAKATACTLLTEGEKSLFAKLLCRERQLRTALAEIASLRLSIAARTIYWNFAS